MKIKMIAPSGEVYEFTEPEYIKIIVEDGGSQLVYYFKKATKKRGYYLNSQGPKDGSSGK